MSEFLMECYQRTNRPYVVQTLMTATNAKYEENQRIMNKLVSESKRLSV